MGATIKAEHGQGKRKRTYEVIIIVEYQTPQSKSNVPKLTMKKGTVR